MTIFDKMSLRIIKEQALIIGSLAWDEAKKVPGLSIVNQEPGEIASAGDASQVLNKLVEQYTKLFGQASREACKDAVLDLLAELPQEQIPLNLR